MTKKEVIQYFLTYYKPFSDYWFLQECWSGLCDSLCRDKQITERQRSTWLTPCTPETFKKFNRKFKG